VLTKLQNFLFRGDTHTHYEQYGRAQNQFHLHGPWYEMHCRKAMLYEAPCRRAPNEPCRRALNVLCRRALIGPVEGCRTCLMLHFCSHVFFNVMGLYLLNLHGNVQCHLTFTYNQNCNQLYSAHRMIFATLLQCCQHDSGSSFVIKLFFAVEAAFLAPV
jgi:hypothetical protein